jgi:taurine dioxygenase
VVAVSFPADVAGTEGRKPFFVSNREPEAGAPYGRLLFHADMMWAPNPFQVLSLYGLHVDSGAATTTFTSATHAWDTLPADLRARVEGLHARHVTGQQMRADDEHLLQPIRAQEESTVTPIAHRHPRTGRTILYVSQMMTREIVELPAAESEALLQELFAHLYDPAHLYEHVWHEQDLVVFDNLAMQHARGDVRPDGPTRTLRKVFAPIPVMAAEAPRFASAN